APAQDGDGMAARGEADGLLIKDGLHAPDDWRTGVVQQPHALARGHISEAAQVMTGGSSRITVRSSGFSITSTSGRPPLYPTLKESLPFPSRMPRTSTLLA